MSLQGKRTKPLFILLLIVSSDPGVQAVRARQSTLQETLGSGDKSSMAGSLSTALLAQETAMTGDAETVGSADTMSIAGSPLAAALTQRTAMTDEAEVTRSGNTSSITGSQSTTALAQETAKTDVPDSVWKALEPLTGVPVLAQKFFFYDGFGSGLKNKILDGSTNWYLRHFGTNMERIEYAVAIAARAMAANPKLTAAGVAVVVAAALFGYWYFSSRDKDRQVEKGKVKIEKALSGLNSSAVTVVAAGDARLKKTLLLSSARAALLKAQEENKCIVSDYEDLDDYGNFFTLLKKAECGSHGIKILQWNSADLLLQQLIDLDIEVPKLEMKPERKPHFDDPAMRRSEATIDETSEGSWWDWIGG